MQRRSSLKIFLTVIYALVLREMQGRFGRIRMGAMWTIFEPLAHILAITAIMVYLRGRSIPGLDFPVFLLVSLTPFLLYKNISLKLMSSVEANKALFAYKQIQPFSTFVARAVVEFSLSATVFIILLAAFTWIGFDTRIVRPIEWLGVIALGLVFAFALGLNLVMIVSVLPESKMVLRLIFMPLYLLSGVVYPPSHFPPQWMPLLLWNPFLHFMELIRVNVFPFYRIADGISLEYVIHCTLVLLFLGMGMYRLRRLQLMSL
ncbi:ABC transporter permease [Bordetella sp. BOR01]|uniref:ABC transporter permease n=1 Tax=Bordetella sp. BOR01 TaxID=2854779 RepID=UPI001C457FE3|nr:ABC transporter permease [Bordetella sp. BOR01]MBV7486192.1 ABC transporter permease [Bordetella sp. BOR01]